MTENIDNSRWAIPFAISYAKLGLIIRFIKNNNGATKFVPLKTIYNLTSINHQLLKANTSFCQIAGILEGDPDKGYKLTSRGTALAEALTLDKPELIKKAILEIIENSHLNNLKTFVDTAGDKLTKEDFFKNVKNLANISDGKRFGQMPPAYSTGTGTLLEMFAKAELIPTKLTESIISQNKKSTPPITGSSKKPKSQQPPKPKDISVGSSSTLPHLGKLIVKGVGEVDINDKDTLSLAEMYLKILSKKINEKEIPPKLS